MANNNIRLPGTGASFDRQDDEAVATPVVLIPDFSPPKQQSRQPARQKRQPVQQEQQQAVELPFSKLFKSHGGKSLTPVEKFLFGGSGFLLWCVGAWWTGIFMQQNIPAFKSATASTEATIAGLVVSFIFMLIELFIWKGGHSIVVWIVSLFLLGIDIWMNFEGLRGLWGIDTHTSGAGFALAGIGAVCVAVLPEIFMSAAGR